jgi:hypothetical protein
MMRRIVSSTCASWAVATGWGWVKVRREALSASRAPFDVPIQPDVVLPAGRSEHRLGFVVILDAGVVAAKLAVELAGLDDAVSAKPVDDGAQFVVIHG